MQSDHLVRFQARLVTNPPEVDEFITPAELDGHRMAARQCGYRLHRTERQTGENGSPWLWATFVPAL